jgi:hypothetical protein
MRGTGDSAPCKVKITLRMQRVCLIITRIMGRRCVVNSNPLLELASKLSALRERKEALKEEEKQLNDEIADVEQQLVDMMISEEMQNFTYSGKLFYLNQQVRVSPRAEVKEKVFAWLKDNGYEDLVYETVNSNRFSAFCKELMEENDGELPEDLAGLVNVFERTAVGMRKAK